MMEREDGFTLIELLIAIIITGIIMEALVTSMIVGLRTTDSTASRLNQSHDVQNATAFFQPDVASANDVSLTDTACANVAPVVRLQWADALSGSPVVVSYFVRVAAGERQLIRRRCDNGVNTSEVPVSHYLSDATPTASCAPLASCPGRPSRVTLQVTACARDAFFVCEPDSLLTYSVLGALRDMA